MEKFEINKLSDLHDSVLYIFCKTDFLIEEFNRINKIPNDVILISGNSDYGITDEYIKLLPNNVKKWYCQNCISNNEKLVPIPIGIENENFCFRDGHGIGYTEKVKEKKILIDTYKSIIPNKKIYSNFNIDTNYHHRSEVKKISIECPHIDWEENNLSLPEYYKKMSDYESIVCPAGNGVDTHRLWETLYMNKIPITIKMGNFKIYELYEQLPILILDNILELYDFDFINKKIEQIKSKNYNYNLLDVDFWKKTISYEN